MGWNPLKSAFNHVKKFTKKSVSYVKKYAKDPMTWLTGGAEIVDKEELTPARGFNPAFAISADFIWEPL